MHVCKRDFDLEQQVGRLTKRVQRIENLLANDQDLPDEVRLRFQGFMDSWRWENAALGVFDGPEGG